MDSHNSIRLTFRKIAGILVVSLLLGSAMGGCSTMHTLGLWRAEGINSFYGVSFGDALLDVQMRYPAGEMQTAPTGATAWVLRNIRENGAQYREVWFEFVDASMQLVLARFDPSETTAVSNAFMKELGPPIYMAGSSKSAAHARILEWKLITGEKVLISEISQQLVIVGPKGMSLTEGIELGLHSDSHNAQINSPIT